jgi:peptidyl-prolyl cis-trans isomerase B (cyclophilin B)
MIKKLSLLSCLILVFAATGCGGKDLGTFGYQTKNPRKNDTIAIMKTNMGDIKIKFFPNEAPKAVENFITHAKNGYYNGVTFHRVINEFMIQGGDPTATGMGGESIWNAPFEDEFTDKLHNIRGALSMANSGPNTNGSQFFIVQKGPFSDDEMEALKQNGYDIKLMEEYRPYGGTPWLDNRHTVFGQVIEGMDVVDAIAAVEVGENDKPLADVVIESIEVVEN